MSFIAVDLTNDESVRSAAQMVADQYPALHLLVNNAAIFLSIKRKPFYELSEKEWDQVTAVNIKGPFLCTKSVFPQMKRICLVF